MLSPMEEKEFWKMLKRIGRNLRKVRTDRNKSQEQMSELIGITYRNYQKLEHGDQPLSMRSLFRISRRSNISIKKLVQ
jgi:transcriptional regulator with XRE-family HTH domain